MTSAVKWVIGGIVGVGVLLMVCSGPGPVAPTPPNVDSLKAVNASLAHQNNKLKAQVAQLTLDRDDLRDSIGVMTGASALATDSIRSNRTKLPPASAVPADKLRESYAAGLLQLDRALAELGRKDQIIRQLRLAQTLSDQIEADLRQLLANTEAQYGHEQEISADWKRQSDSLFTEIHKLKCGRKCGIVIGIASTVGAAIAIKKVNEAVDSRRPD